MYLQVFRSVSVGQQTSQDYAKKAFQWAKALRLLDPSIKLISCGGVFSLLPNPRISADDASLI
jgi:hypothetical protein